MGYAAPAPHAVVPALHHFAVTRRPLGVGPSRLTSPVRFSGFWHTSRLTCRCSGLTAFAAERPLVRPRVPEHRRRFNRIRRANVAGLGYAPRTLASLLRLLQFTTSGRERSTSSVHFFASFAWLPRVLHLRCPRSRPPSREHLNSNRSPSAVSAANPARALGWPSRGTSGLLGRLRRGRLRVGVPGFRSSA